MLIGPCAVFAAPVVLYTDISSGPNTGGESNNGAYLSIFGKGFGSNISRIKVYVGGSGDVTHEVARYIYVGPSLGRSDIDEVAVQLGPNVATGQIKVVVDGIASNTDQSFTVRAGNIYFISPSGSNSTGQVNQISRPFLSANYVHNLSSFQAGDFIIALPGTYVLSQTDAPSNAGTMLRASKSGTTSAPNAFLGYPGHGAVLNHSNALRIISNYVSISNWVVGGFSVNLTDCVSNGEFITLGTTTTPQVCQDTAGTVSGKATNIKIVNIEADGHDTGGFCSGGDGLIEIMYSQGVKVIGVSLHNTSPVQGDSESAHAIYLSARQSGTEVAWNTLYNIPATRGVIQVHQDSFSGTCWGTKQLTDIAIHDNVLHDLAGQNILLDGGTGDITLYNNLIYNNLDHRYNDVISLRGSGGTLNAKLYNNTVYVNTNTGGRGFLIGIGSSGLPQHVTLYNNIFALADSQDVYYGSDWYSSAQLLSWIQAGNVTSDNNIWYGSSGAVPPFVGAHEQSTDPAFVSPGFNFHLLNPGSPAIDHGTSAVATVVTRDLDGNLRPQGTTIDIGAMETAGTSLPTPTNFTIQRR